AGPARSHIPVHAERAPALAGTRGIFRRHHGEHSRRALSSLAVPETDRIGRCQRRNLARASGNRGLVRPPDRPGSDALRGCAKGSLTMRLGVVSNVVHYATSEGLYAYGPYARELDIWADLFDEVTILGPCRNTRPPGDAVPFTRKNITIVPQKECGGDTLSAKLSLLLS